MNKGLDLNTPVPLYFQLQEYLRQEIEEGKYPSGSHLPTEAELVEMYGVSRTTVREALRGLAQRGLIIKRQGLGSFVANNKIVEVLPGLVSFSFEMEARGFAVESYVLEKRVLIPPPRVLNALQLSQKSQVTQVKRLRHVDKVPIVLSTSFLHNEVSIDEDFSGSIYSLLESKYDQRIISGRTSIEAGTANDYESDLLEIKLGDAVLQITWLAYNEHNIPVEYSEATYRGDRYRYVVQLRRY